VEDAEINYIISHQIWRCPCFLEWASVADHSTSEELS